MESGIVRLVLWALALGAGFLSIALGAILSYHWFNFGGNTMVSTIASILYGAGALTLVIILIALAASI